MSDKRNLMKKTDNPSSSQISYSRCKEGILKGVSELSASSNTDIGLVMISPTDEVTTYAPEGKRVEDVFLSCINQPDGFEGSVEDKELLCQKLKKSKFEGEMLEKLGSLMALEKELFEISQEKDEAWNKMRSYHPDVSQIQSISEAEHHEQVVLDAIHRIEKLKNEKVIEEEASRPSEFTDDEMPADEVDSDRETEEAAKGKSYILALPAQNAEEGMTSDKGEMPKEV